MSATLFTELAPHMFPKPGTYTPAEPTYCFCRSCGGLNAICYALPKAWQAAPNCLACGKSLAGCEVVRLLEKPSQRVSEPEAAKTETKK